LGGKALRHFTHGGPQPESIGPDENAGVGTAGWMNESSVASAIGRLDFYVGLNDRCRAGGRTCNGEACYYGCYEVAPRKVA
jgi:hypothetical protein